MGAAFRGSLPGRDEAMRKLDPEKHEAKRQQILRAATACFARRGFHQTRTAEICAEAGMSPGNLFHYFDSKEAIIEALVEEERHEAAQVFEQLRQADDLLQGLLDLVDVAFDALADRSEARLAVEIGAEAMRNPRIAAMFERSDAETKAALIGVLTTAVARGQIDPTLDLPSTAGWLIALFDGMISRAAIDPTFDAAAQAPMLRLLVARFLRPQPTASA
jgi:TetR/AcrR family transcriptional repressor of uid operon